MLLFRGRFNKFPASSTMMCRTQLQCFREFLHQSSAGLGQVTLCLEQTYYTIVSKPCDGNTSVPPLSCSYFLSFANETKKNNRNNQQRLSVQL